MKALTQGQYDWLLAVHKGDQNLVTSIEEHYEGKLGTRELDERGLYTCTDDPNDSTCYVSGSLRITSAGRYAIMAYQVLKGITS